MLIFCFSIDFNNYFRGRKGGEGDGLCNLVWYDMVVRFYFWEIIFMNLLNNLRGVVFLFCVFVFDCVVCFDYELEIEIMIFNILNFGELFVFIKFIKYF